jgi:SAM-dependent methyltransferase
MLSIFAFNSNWRRYILVADVGCGNGKNMPQVAALGGLAVGCDFSMGLLDICAEERGLEAGATTRPLLNST